MKQVIIIIGLISIIMLAGCNSSKELEACQRDKAEMQIRHIMQMFLVEKVQNCNDLTGKDVLIECYRNDIGECDAKGGCQELMKCDNMQTVCEKLDEHIQRHFVDFFIGLGVIEGVEFSIKKDNENLYELSEGISCGLDDIEKYETQQILPLRSDNGVKMLNLDFTLCRSYELVK